MCNLIRKYMGYVDGDWPIGGPGKTVEADETFIGGKIDNDGERPDDKAIVFGIVERGGDVVTRHVQGRSQRALDSAHRQTREAGNENLYRRLARLSDC